MSDIIYHKHHIIPKSLGGSDDESNIVKLTVSGHVAVHKWMYESYGRWQDRVAYMSMSGMIGKAEVIRETQRGCLGRIRPASERKAISRGNKGKTRTEEMKQYQYEIKRKQGLCKEVVIDDVMYRSIHDAARTLGVDRKTVKKMMKGVPVFTQSIPVVIDGVTYKSINDASRQLNLSPYKIKKSKE